LATSLPLEEASPEVVDEGYRLRDGIEQCSKPVKHELGWGDYQMRPERAIVRHWQLVLLAFTFSLLVGALPPPAEPDSTGASCGRRRCVGCRRGSAPGLGCGSAGNVGRAASRRPSWPRSSPISPAVSRWRRICLRPQPDQPATSLQSNTDMTA